MGIRKLARELDLSIGTVSRALNDRPDVNAATRARVKAAAAAAGYVPNQSGRSLRKGCTGIVAAVIPPPRAAPGAEAVFLHVLEGARGRFAAASVELIALFRGPEEDPLENLRGIVSRRLMDGVVIGQIAPSDPRIGFLAGQGVPFVAFGRSEGGIGHAWVDFDHEGAAREAARAFLRDGHARLALAPNEFDPSGAAILERAFRAEAARLGLPADAVARLETRGGRLTPGGRAALAEPGRAPTAVLAGDEWIAASLYAEFAALGRPVGVDSAVISAVPALDPTALAPPLTSFDADLCAIGAALAELLLARLPGVENRPTAVPAPPPGALVRRGSHLTRNLATA